jgi:hypothetical protein
MPLLAACLLLLWAVVAPLAVVAARLRRIVSLTAAAAGPIAARPGHGPSDCRGTRRRLATPVAERRHRSQRW